MQQLLIDNSAIADNVHTWSPEAGGFAELLLDLGQLFIGESIIGNHAVQHLQCEQFVGDGLFPLCP